MNLSSNEIRILNESLNNSKESEHKIKDIKVKIKELIKKNDTLNLSNEGIMSLIEQRDSLNEKVNQLEDLLLRIYIEQGFNSDYFKLDLIIETQKVLGK